MPKTLLKMKKAQVMNRIALIIKMLVILGVLAIFIWQVVIRIDSHTVESTCRNSVKLASLKIGGKSVYDTLKCPTQYETIEGDDDTINHELAERMRKCYWMFWEGKLELFDEESENFCVICYVASFKEKKQIKGFTNYLATHNLPSRRDFTYYDYLTSHTTTPELVFKTEGAIEDVIDTNLKYAVMFNYVKPEYLSWLEAGGYGGAAGGAAAVVGLTALSFVPGVNFVTIPMLFVAGGSGFATGFYFGQGKGEAPHWSSSMMLWPYTEEEAKRLQCNYAPAATK